MTIGDLYFKIRLWKEDIMNFKITDVFSWRGIYAEPACSIECIPSTKEENLKMLDRLTSEVFEGWKGGEYEYDFSDELHFEERDGAWSDGQYLIDFLLENSNKPIVKHIFKHNE